MVVVVALQKNKNFARRFRRVSNSDKEKLCSFFESFPRERDKEYQVPAEWSHVFICLLLLYNAMVSRDSGQEGSGDRHPERLPGGDCGCNTISI